MDIEIKAKKQVSSHALAAKMIKEELKQSFPECKFSVVSDSYTGGDAVRVSYTDGVHVKSVENIVNKYQYGHFDGMRDIYEMSNCRNDIPQVKYIIISWDLSDEVIKRGCENFAKHFGIEFSGDPYATCEAIKNFTAHHWSFFEAVREKIYRGELLDVDGNFL